MNELAQIGKKRTILMAVSILLVSIHTIFFYHYPRPDIDLPKLGQQVIRFGLTALLLLYVYRGKSWARILSLVLFSLAAIGALGSIISMDASWVAKVPLVVMLVIYSFAIHHFGISVFFKEFFAYQNSAEDSE